MNHLVGGDANGFTTGFVIGNNIANAPSTGWWAFITIKAGNTTGAQMAISISGGGGGDIKSRSIGSGNWGAWV